MGLLRRRGGDEGTKYRMREKLFAVGDDFWIEDEEGSGPSRSTARRCGSVTRSCSRTPSGEELYKIQEKKLTIRDKMEIERDGATVATVKKALITPLRDRFSIEVEGGEDMDAKGNIVDHEYKIERDGEKVAEVSKRWFRVRDTYGIEIAPGEDDALILAVKRLHRPDGPRLTLLGGRELSSRRVSSGDPGCPHDRRGPTPLVLTRARARTLEAGRVRTTHPPLWANGGSW